ncbi:hypothetical protein M1437_02465 [Patescibacteria group bacterium]|nr:hypothetical protein [Patescibacteria group bacterium]
MVIEALESRIKPVNEAPAKVIQFRKRGIAVKKTKPEEPTHSRIFGNGNPEELTFGGIGLRNGNQVEEYVAGTPGWKFNFDTGNYDPIGPVK